MQSSANSRHIPEFHGRIAQGYLNQDIDQVRQRGSNPHTDHKSLTVSRQCGRNNHKHHRQENVFRHRL